jgi:GT2 family glycosyltransferase
VSAAAPEEVVALAESRAAARSEKDFARADELRDRIAAAGWTVVDEPDGWRLEPAAAPEVTAAGPVSAASVESLLDRPPTVDVSVHWVWEGWPEDIERAVAAFRAHEGGFSVQYVVADVVGQTWPEWVESVQLQRRTGWAAARNAGLKRSRGRVVLAMDGSIEPTGDVFSPLVDALADETIGVCGPFGIVTRDLREFDEAPSPGDVDAVEGYLMAFRRELLGVAGLFDEKFKWYRTADIEWSFRVKDAGFRTVVLSVPVTKHEHRMWFETDPADRGRWSKRNYYRFLELWRDRWDLVLSGKPDDAAGDQR